MKLLPIILILCSYIAPAQPLQFDNLTSNEGLPQNTVSALLEDAQGFIWVGTRHGLCRYDGTSFKYFMPERAATGGTPHWSINSLAQDKKGNIWVGHGNTGGLSLYFYKKDKWINFPGDSTARRGPGAPYVNDILVARDGRIWFTSGQYLQEVVYKGDSFIFNSYSLGAVMPKKAINIYRVIEGPGNSFWLATSYGLMKFDRNKKQIVYGDGQLDDSNGKSLRCLYADKQGYLWLGPRNGGIAVLPPGKWKPGSHFERLPDRLSVMKNAIVFDILEDRKGDMQFGTAKGLITYRKHDNPSFIFSRHIEGNDQSLQNDFAGHLLEDASGNLWVGTERGLSRHFKYGHPFHKLNTQTLGNNFNDRVTRVLADKDGYIWSGGEQCIQRTNLHDTDIVNIKVPGLISGMLDDGKGNIWAVTIDWLIKIRKSDMHTENIPVAYTAGQFDKNITNMIMDPATGDIWLSGAAAVLCFSPPTRTWKSAALDYRTFVTGLDIAPDGRIFAADASFLFEIDKQNMVFRPFDKDGNGMHNHTRYLDYTKDIHYNDGKIYIAQASGLFAYDLQKKSWREWHLEDGLSSEAFRAVMSDKNGNIWLSGNNGIMSLDKNGKIRQFTNPNVLPALEFNSRAKTKDRAGNIYFGNDKGVIYFDPGEFSDNPYKPPVYFTGFELFNEQVHVGAPDTPGKNSFYLDNSIQFTDHLNLEYRHSVFSVSFAALNYLHSEKNTYAHRLIGFDKDWVYDGTKTSVTYTNLQPGEYELQVKAANNDNVWSDKTASLKIYVAPPWYKTWWAYAGYIIGVISITWFFVRYRIEQIRKQAEINAAKLRARTAEAEKEAIEMKSLAVIEKARLQEREAMRKKSAQDFHDEAGIKLSRIGLLTTVARQNSKDEELTHYLNKIEENAQDLSSSMRDFIWVLDPEQDTFYAALQRLQDFGNKLFEYSGIEFKSQGIEPYCQNQVLSFEEKRHTILIFKEAMNNALKYSRAKNILLSVKETDSSISITLQDDGKGFEMPLPPDSYGIRNMQNRAAKIEAAITIETAPGSGVKVKLEIEKKNAEKEQDKAAQFDQQGYNRQL